LRPCSPGWPWQKTGPGGTGKPALVTITADGNNLDEGTLPKTLPLQLSLGEGVDVGMLAGSAIGFTCKLPFTDTIENGTIEMR